MLKKLSLLIFTLLVFQAFTTSPVTITVTTTFTPLHTYFMAASSCSNANSGVDAAHPWCNPDNNGHVGLVCGDVIIAAAGTYSGMDITHTPTGCGVSGTVTTGSSSGGIDGTGGIFFAIVLCGGSDLEACQVNVTGDNTGFRFLDVSCCWAVEGFKINGNATGYDGERRDGFQVRACLDNTPTQAHHFAFINNIVYNATSGYGTNDCGQSSGSGPGVDYWAVVGSIAQNSNQHHICLAAIDAPAPSQWNLNAGTHILFYGSFSYAGMFDCSQNIDSEGFMFDTWDGHGYTATGVMLNNMAWFNWRQGFKSFNQTNGGPASTQKFINNTAFANNAGESFQGGGGAIGDVAVEVGGGVSTLSTNYVFKDNIVRSNYTITPGGSGDIYAFYIFPGTSASGSWTITTNVFSAQQTVCDFGVCDPGFNTSLQGSGIGTAWWATTNFNDPAFTNTTDLLSNWVGVPSCTGKQNVTQCMGWDAVTGTLTANTPISDLTPTAIGTNTKGYQKPTMTCAPNADFPIWLKGIVYLHWTGTIVQQKAGLVNVPCGM